CQPSQRIVMRGLLSDTSFSADALASVHHGRLLRAERKIDRKLIRGRGKMLPGMIGRHGRSRPAIDPHVQPSGLCTGFSQPGPAEFLSIQKPVFLHIGKCGMSKVQMPDGPSRRIAASFRMIDRSAKERELVTEVMPVGRGQMTCVIPPFGAEVIVRTMILRKDIGISWSSCLEGNWALL